jgi:hypothetical protein
LGCETDIGVEIGWKSAGRVDVVPADVRVFEETEKIQTLSAKINA